MNTLTCIVPYGLAPQSGAGCIPTLSAYRYTSVLLSPLPVIPVGIAGIQGQGRQAAVGTRPG
jgi:hypothetical protein